MNRSYTSGNYLRGWLLAACAFMSLPTLCQDSHGSGKISGTIADPKGSPVVGAQVILDSNSTSAERRRTATDKMGHYEFSALPLGAYKMSAAAPGFRDSEAKIVFLTSASAIANLTLSSLESGQSSKAGGAPQDTPPTFTPAGARGAIAPSGYASGLSSEEAAHVQASARALAPTLFTTLAAATPPDCSQESALLRAVEKAPQDFAPNHALGAFYLGYGDSAKGVQYLAAAHTIVPSDFTNSRDLAVAMIGDGRGSDAATLLEQLMPGHESDSTLLRLLAFAYRSARENEKSVAAFRKAALSDAGGDNQYDCGVGLLQLGALKEALELFSAAVKAHPESARLWLGLGIADHLADHNEEAVSSLLRSADADPAFLPPLALLAELSGLSDQMKSDLRRRIAAYLVAHPDDADARFAYALVLWKQSRPQERGNSLQEVDSQLKRALQLNPRMARAHFLLADADAAANNIPGAIDQLVEGLKLEPGDARAHYRLSLLHRRNGQQEAARKEMDAFLALHGNSGDEGLGDTPITSSFTVPSIQQVPAQPACDPKLK